MNMRTSEGMTGIELLRAWAESNNIICPPACLADPEECDEDARSECMCGALAEIADRIEREMRPESHVCENCRYWLPYSKMCARLDFFTEYGIDTMSMGPNDYCSKWEAR